MVADAEGAMLSPQVGVGASTATGYHWPRSAGPLAAFFDRSQDA